MSKYDLKKRDYVGNTSFDAELSLITANQALVRSLLHASHFYIGGTRNADIRSLLWNRELLICLQSLWGLRMWFLPISCGKLTSLGSDIGINFIRLSKAHLRWPKYAGERPKILEIKLHSVQFKCVLSRCFDLWPHTKSNSGRHNFWCYRLRPYLSPLIQANFSAVWCTGGRQKTGQQEGHE